VDDLVRAIVLGVVQGLTEFLPISSSGHLILVPALFDWPDQGLAFDVGLHVGTLLALLVYFWRDWWQMAASGLGDLRYHGLRLREYAFPSRLLLLIALGSVPAAVVGFALSGWIEENVRQPWLVAIMLACFGFVMLYADRTARRTRGVEGIGVRDALFVGVAQACALIPGVSRSGATISAGLLAGLRRDDAARFAFLLGTPAFVGAALLKANDLIGESSVDTGEMLVGMAVSALVGLAAIHFLLRFLRTRTLVPFVCYRWGVAVVTLAIGAYRVW
jgi:undecaprenyl-diphosphatase